MHAYARVELVHARDEFVHARGELAYARVELVYVRGVLDLWALLRTEMRRPAHFCAPACAYLCELLHTDMRIQMRVPACAC